MASRLEAGADGRPLASSRWVVRLTWGGLFAALVGAQLNWRNSRAGYWANLAVVSGLDVGFVLFVVAPGHISLESGLPGPVLWIVALVLTSVGRAQATGGAAPPTA